MKVAIGNITLIGTNHVSEASGTEITDHCKENPVDIVCVELDEKRYSRIHQGDTGFSMEDMQKHIEQLGLPGYLLSVVIAFFQRVLAILFNIKPGHDMITATEYAKKENKLLVFIDQDAELTLRRFSEKFTLEEALTILPKMVVYSISDMVNKDSEIFTMLDLRKVPPLKLIRLINKRTKIIFPTFYKVIIDDRNRYMAKEIIRIAEEYPDSHILVVIGGGHLDGVSSLLKKHFPPSGDSKETSDT
jgi:pheromone shutdown protein TraB